MYSDYPFPILHSHILYSYYIVHHKKLFSINYQYDNMSGIIKEGMRGDRGGIDEDKHPPLPNKYNFFPFVGGDMG